jgi:hypothetical protein
MKSAVRHALELTASKAAMWHADREVARRGFANVRKSPRPRRDEIVMMG